MEVAGSLLLVIDRAISLVKQRQTRNQAIVKEVIGPMFQDLEIVQRNYNVLFQQTKNAWEEACRRYAEIKASYSIPR